MIIHLIGMGAWPNVVIRVEGNVVHIVWYKHGVKTHPDEWKSEVSQEAAATVALNSAIQAVATGNWIMDPRLEEPR